MMDYSTTVALLLHHVDKINESIDEGNAQVAFLNLYHAIGYSQTALNLPDLTEAEMKRLRKINRKVSLSFGKIISNVCCYRSDSNYVRFIPFDLNELKIDYNQGDINNGTTIHN